MNVNTKNNPFVLMVVPDMDTQPAVEYPILLPPEDEGTWIENGVRQILDQTRSIRQTERPFSIRHLGAHLVFSSMVIARETHTDWAILPLSEDPSYSGSGKFLLPKAVIRHLKTLKNRGFSFDTLYIAHEVPKDTLFSGERLPLELIAPPVPPAVEKAERLGELSGMAWMSMAPLLPVVNIAKYVAAIPLAVVLDPILFGLKFKAETQPNAVELADWYYLCHWTW